MKKIKQDFIKIYTNNPHFIYFFNSTSFGMLGDNPVKSSGPDGAKDTTALLSRRELSILGRLECCVSQGAKQLTSRDIRAVGVSCRGRPGTHVPSGSAAGDVQGRTCRRSQLQLCGVPALIQFLGTMLTAYINYLAVHRKAMNAKVRKYFQEW